MFSLETKQRNETTARGPKSAKAPTSRAAAVNPNWTKLAMSVQRKAAEPAAERSSTAPELASMERAFGADFSAVRVHRDGRADAAKAHALTVGDDIHLSPSAGPLQAEPANRFLAHELAHVLQQREGARGSAPETTERSEARADDAASAVLRGGGVPHLGAARPGSVQHKKQPAPPGGAILYVGMNNYKPEVAQIDNRYSNVDVKVTKVTVTDTDTKFPVGSTTVDLGTPQGRKDFCATLPGAATVAGPCEKLLETQSGEDRDDLAHVIQVYAQTQDDGVDRMSRVVLSGHSYGTKIYNEDPVTKTSKGAILFSALVTLATIFPKAAAQTRHLMVLACLAGDESNVTSIYRKAYPSLVSFSGWTSLCPTGWGAASALDDWLAITDKDPKSSLPKPDTGRSNWIDSVYQGNDYQDDTALLASLHGDDATFKKYVDGDKVDPDNHSGTLFEFYRRARIASNRPTITGAEHVYAQTSADQSFRLRFWPAMVSRFWAFNKKALEAAKVPDLSKMKRKDALSSIATFLASGGSGTDFDAAVVLLKGLRDLDAKILHDDWLSL